jgi:hypothetical protein
MTRGELLTSALGIVSNSTDFWEKAKTWVNDALREVENYGDWSFLQRETTYACENEVDEVAFSAAKFPAAAITDFSKQMKVYRPDYGELTEIADRREFNSIRGLGETGIPTHFFVGYGSSNESLFLFPTFVTGETPTTLTLSYCGEMVFPDEDSDDLETVSGIKPKLQGFLENYVRARLFQQIDDDRQEAEMGKWQQGLSKMLAEDLTGSGAIAGGAS